MAALKEARVASTASTAALASHALAAVATSVAGFWLAPASEVSHSNAAVAEAEAATARARAFALAVENAFTDAAGVAVAAANIQTRVGAVLAPLQVRMLRFVEQLRSWNVDLPREGVLACTLLLSTSLCDSNPGYL